MVDCANCIEKCPQAAAANEIAKGRMFAEREFINLINKIENGTLVEVVRCGECKFWGTTLTEEDRSRCAKNGTDLVCDYWLSDGLFATDYCSYGERKGGVNDEAD